MHVCLSVNLSICVFVSVSQLKDSGVDDSVLQQLLDLHGEIIASIQDQDCLLRDNPEEHLQPEARLASGE